MSKTYLVGGMSCQGCVNSVTNAIKAAAPKAEVSVALDAEADSKVTVAGADDEAPVIQAISDAGFEFHGSA
ncbi:MAG: heavy-metal-associated domain-containing protein [Alphaproteobacteria bacterium]|jgi:copper chaperone|nr:heavy-metal-associated domain-containing protein [Alphaproteobacteria bacterium]MDP6623274.1 heavy-metal-associated domain-containing protein [Alphaproteobacteria bacterium]MDP7602209.1 heavy-metal-associated domain-containing protein [Alphaproteobacteria bacterium]HJP22735.1 heavy-metal-associated domain-containing protein [Alphaproteobacteria bacterium]|tara:strand:+ start:273 stop:485 length:213 start_codon:yes stop_codon:yes gene_type:complete